jgi:hypothetical protein
MAKSKFHLWSGVIRNGRFRAISECFYQSRHILLPFDRLEKIYALEPGLLCKVCAKKLALLQANPEAREDYLAKESMCVLASMDKQY